MLSQPPRCCRKLWGWWRRFWVSFLGPGWVKCQIRFVSWFLLALQSMSAELGLAGEQELVHQLFKVLKLGFLPACNQTESFRKFSMASCLHVPRSWGQSRNLPQQAEVFGVHISAMSISSPLFLLCCLPTLIPALTGPCPRCWTHSLCMVSFPQCRGLCSPLQPLTVTLHYLLMKSD